MVINLICFDKKEILSVKIELILYFGQTHYFYIDEYLIHYKK